jgi:non-heme chloroperoxidase
MTGGLLNQYECIRAFSETDFTKDLDRFDVPTLVIHGYQDQIVPIAVAGMRSARLIKNAALNVYKDAPHAVPVTHRDRVNADLLAFLAGAAPAEPSIEIHRHPEAVS